MGSDTDSTCHVESPQSIENVSEATKTVDKKKKEYVCDYPDCGAKFIRPWKLTAHRCVHTGERPFTCTLDECTRSYTNATHLRRHYKKVHLTSNDTIPKPVFKCDQPGCNGRSFGSSYSLKRHVKRTHAKSEGSDNKEEPGIKSNRYSCTDCGKDFNRHNRLKGHRYYHDGQIPFRCEVCGQGYIQQLDLKRHMRSHKTWRCKESGCTDLEEFQTWSLLRAHMALKHSPGLECNKCGRVFKVKSSMRSHRKDCRGPEELPRGEGPWPCPVEGCERRFTTKRNATLHARHRHGEERFACTVEGCERSFIWKCTLDKHVKQHDLKRPPRPKKKRKTRKDAGIPKSSMAEILSTTSTVIFISNDKEEEKVEEEKMDDGERKEATTIPHCTPLQTLVDSST